jgi:hypothetical protein
MQVIVILASSLRTRWTASLLILYLYSRFFPFIYCVSISWPLPSAERHGRASPSPGGSFFRISLQRYCFLFEFFFVPPSRFYLLSVHVRALLVGRLVFLDAPRASNLTQK